jgi:hypothetical protein
VCALVAQVSGRLASAGLLLSRQGMSTVAMSPAEHAANLDRMQKEYTEALDEFNGVTQALAKQLAEYEASNGHPFLYRYVIASTVGKLFVSDLRLHVRA